MQTLPYESLVRVALSERLAENGAPAVPKGRIVTAEDILKMDLPKVEFAVDPLVSTPGLWLVNGSQKAGKTMFGAQLALTLTAGAPLLDRYQTQGPTGAMFIEQDDPSGVAALRRILDRTPVQYNRQRFYSIVDARFQIEPGFIEFLEAEITSKRLGVLVLDSYTAMRGPRNGSTDLVKAESIELGLLDALAKRTGCLILVIHHASKGSAALDWSDRSAGTYAMGAHSEGQVFVSRFPDLPSTAPERLVQIRGRHVRGAEMVLRFDERTLSYDLVFEGPAAGNYPELMRVKEEFGVDNFSPADVCKATGISRAGAHRLIGRLVSGQMARKVGFGQYHLDREVMAL